MSGNCKRAHDRLIVMNDDFYAAIALLQDANQDGRRFHGELQGPGLRGLAALAEMPLRRVDSAAMFGSSRAAALATAGPTMVEVDFLSFGSDQTIGPPVQATRTR